MPCAGQRRHLTAGGPTRTYAQNDKDMVLATCIANAYRNDKDATADAGSRERVAGRDRLRHGKEPGCGPVAGGPLSGAELANPLAEAEVKGLRVDRLKCLDLYHSRELEALARQLVIHPGHTYRQDNPSCAAPK